jgi:hypothetical protein
MLTVGLLRYKRQFSLFTFMREVVISFALLACIFVTGACSRKQVNSAQPGEAATAPSESYAMVTMSDGSRYRGQLISKSGSQMTFRGDNGAIRTLDSQDIRSIKFEDVGSAPTSSNSAPRSYEPTVPRPSQYPPPTSVGRRASIPSGTQISVRNNQAIDSKTASVGQTFSAVVSADVSDDSGAIAIPRGSSATLVVRAAGAGKIHANDLALDLGSITIGGVDRDVQTGTLFKKGRDGVGANKRTAIFSGGGAAIGALIGGLAGGGRGAAIGAASGAGAGAGTQILTRGSVKIPSESLMSFTLEAPLTE